MRKVIYTILVLTMALSLAACAKKTKTEAEVEADIISKYTSLQEYQGQESYNFEVVLRKTDSKNGTDEVQCVINAANELMASTYNITVYYYLYDQGWILENVEITESKTTPLKTTITLEQARKDFEHETKIRIPYLNPDDCVLIRETVDLDNNKHVFYFGDPNKNIGYEIEYTFSSGWNRGYEWILSGVWYISNEDGVIPAEEVIIIPAED